MHMGLPQCLVEVFAERRARFTNMGTHRTQRLAFADWLSWQGVDTAKKEDAT